MSHMTRRVICDFRADTLRKPQTDPQTKMDDASFETTVSTSTRGEGGDDRSPGLDDRLNPEPGVSHTQPDIYHCPASDGLPLIVTSMHV